METTSSLQESQEHPHLERRIGLVQATALNMINMVGAGPFITIPLLMSTMGGPQALLGWVVAALICIPDGMVWAELGSAMPGSGGSYIYLREAYGPQKWGRLMAFLFIWQFILSGPLELASGYIGFGQYASYIWHDMTPLHIKLVAAAAGIVNIFILFRGISSIGKLSVALWIGMLFTVLCVIIAGASHFNPHMALDFPPDAFRFSGKFFFGLGAAGAFGIYDYLGYYNICYIGDEIRNPARVTPRAIIISLIAVASIYLLMNLAIIGSISWREFVPWSNDNPVSNHLVSILIERTYGSRFAIGFTLMVLLTTYASVFAVLLGYSRIAYAAARDGYFFATFARLHPTLHFPHVALVIIGAISVAACFIPLDTVIAVMLACRILVQFVGQIFAVILLRRNRPDIPRPYQMWLYPLPLMLALIGWSFVFITSGRKIIAFGLAILILGLLAFAIWRRWPHRTPAHTNCAICGNDLRGSVSGVCPQCGTPLDVAPGFIEVRDKRSPDNATQTDDRLI